MECQWVKIGRAKDIRTRLNTLQTGNARELILLCYVPGGGFLESLAHVCWGSLRGRGEWFSLPPALVDRISRAVQLDIVLRPYITKVFLRTLLNTTAVPRVESDQRSG